MIKENNMSHSKMAMLHQAKELTGSTDMPTLIQAASQLEQYLTFDEFKAVATDFSSYLPYCMIQHPTKGPVALKPHGYQYMMANVMQHSNLAVLNVARQMGVTTINAAFALWYASMHPYKTIVIGAPKVAMAIEVLDRARYILEHSPHKVAADVWLEADMTHNTKTQIRFNNGSTISGFSYGSPNTLRGRTIDLFIFQDAAFIPYKFDDEYLMHMCIHGPRTKVIVTSTPKYTDGFFYKVWQAVDERKGSRLTIDYTMHPERDEQWGEIYKARMSEEAFKNEFECQFLKRE
jgi:hypothetical protein